jgi:hypothetical protein
MTDSGGGKSIFFSSAPCKIRDGCFEIEVSFDEFIISEKHILGS